jgi:two-component system nitrogen regulation sensor histidine kinase NtrY
MLILLFSLSSLLLLFAAIWLGISLADILLTPILHLIEMAENVSQGDWTVRAPELRSLPEVMHLVQAFNHMIARIDKQNTELIRSEKRAAWADIARKIAHEVKNPLTPIQLAAERLKRKYKIEIRSDPETFVKCIDTIIRQVSHIEQLVSEFSAFARMPEAVLQITDLTQIVRDVIFMHQQMVPNIRFSFHAVRQQILWGCDGNQMSQVVVNLLQNAINSITESAVPVANSQICVTLQEFEDHLLMVVEDNGPGFQKEQRERLFDPYYTTREKGTGLGLAIVLRFIADHAGTMSLHDAKEHQGARVEIELPRRDLT